AQTSSVKNESTGAAHPAPEYGFFSSPRAMPRVTPRASTATEHRKDDGMATAIFLRGCSDRDGAAGVGSSRQVSGSRPRPATAIRNRSFPVPDVAAVHVNGLSGHLAGPIARQEHDHVRDVLRPLPTAERDAGLDLLGRPLVETLPLVRRLLVNPGL